MVFIIGLSLRLEQLRHVSLLLPVIVIRLLVAPLIGWTIGSALGIDAATLSITVVAMASASPAVGILLAHRYDLDTGLYGAALSLSLVAYMIAAPIYQLLL